MCSLLQHFCMCACAHTRTPHSGAGQNTRQFEITIGCKMEGRCEQTHVVLTCVCLLTSTVSVKEMMYLFVFKNEQQINIEC
jgi:hypothetical protein